ncbi:MAG: hypothetical protein ACK5NA_02530 [Enterococcus sp.]
MSGLIKNIFGFSFKYYGLVIFFSSLIDWFFDIGYTKVQTLVFIYLGILVGTTIGYLLKNEKEAA